MPAAPVAALGRVPSHPHRMRRRALASAFVAGVYVLLTLSAPWLVRYGGDVAPTLAAATQATVLAAPRCATAPEYGGACPDDDAWPD